MAIHAHSTPAPAPQRGLLRAFAHPRTLVANHREIPGSCPPAAPLAAFESTAAQPCNASGLAPEEALASTALAALLEPAEAAEARALHKRRALIQAVEHSFALLDALDLPPLALDTIEQAIAALDALDAPDEDLEDSHDAEDDDVSEDDDPAERDDHHGSEDAEDIGHYASQFAPRSLTRAERAEVAVIASRAATLRRALHV